MEGIIVVIAAGKVSSALFLSVFFDKAKEVKDELLDDLNLKRVQNSGELINQTVTFRHYRLFGNSSEEQLSEKIVRNKCDLPCVALLESAIFPISLSLQ